MPDRAYLHPIDPELRPGARNAVEVCLRLKPEERITIITDTATRQIAAALQKEVERVGSDYSLFVLEHHAPRPLKYMPEIILDDLALSQVSIFAAQTQARELGARTEMTSVVIDHHIRQAKPAFGRTRASGRSHHLHNTARHRVRSGAFAETQVAQNQRAHYARQMG